MNAIKHTAVLALALSLPTLAACGAPAGSEASATESDALTLKPGCNPITHVCPPAWQTSTRGAQVKYVDASGNPTSNVTLTYTGATQTAAITSGAVTADYVVWDTLTSNGALLTTCLYDASSIMAAASSESSGSIGVTGTKFGQVLCNGTPAFFATQLNASWLGVAVANAAGALTLAAVCADTGGRGTFVSLPTYAAAQVSGELPGGGWTQDVIAGGSSAIDLPLNVTIVCQ